MTQQSAATKHEPHETPRPSLRVVRPEDDFSEDQRHAILSIEGWLENPTFPFVLGGYAGTGKTTLISYLAREMNDVAVAALAGKAANVLRSKGVSVAQTIHSLVYAPFEDDYGKVRFRRRDKLETHSGRSPKLIIIDEASMVDEHLKNDLESFDIPILYVGDHGQLEPIGRDTGIMLKPDFALTRIHRQAENNPILRLARAWREGRNVPYWSDPAGRCRILSRRDFDAFVDGKRQIICGYNKTRHNLNARVREALGYSGPPQEDERLICVRNNKKHGIFNGQQFRCAGTTREGADFFDMDVRSEDGREIQLKAASAQFGGNLLDDHRDQDVALLDYGYAITCHKSQGSEWDDVVILDEVATIWDAKRWRYTATTRAKERVTYCY